MGGGIVIPEQALERALVDEEEGYGGDPGSGFAAVMDEGPVPPVPQSLAEIRLTPFFVSDLILKTLYSRGTLRGSQLVDLLRLPFALIDDLLLDLQTRRFVEVRGTDGHGRQSYLFTLTAEGRARAREAREVSAYVGPAPVTGAGYRHWTARQSLRTVRIPPEQIQRGLEHMVLPEDFHQRVGPGINSGRSLFLYGAPGNGKTELAFAIGRVMESTIFIPRMVELAGEIVSLYDPYLHELVDDGGSPEPDEDGPLYSEWPRFDPRFVRIKRPSILVGGELTLEELDLQYDSSTGIHSAPPQMKANGGVFVIDDFGRQRVRPRDLLNRWMIPLDRGVDFLAMNTGHKLTVPFDCLVVFSTNLNPQDLVEEAFLRRIRYKLEVGNPDRDQYTEIFRRVCEKEGIDFDPGAVDFIFENYYDRGELEPRACHPRDVVSDLVDMAVYMGREPTLTPELIAAACESYFPSVKLREAYEMQRGDRRGVD